MPRGSARFSHEPTRALRDVGWAKIDGIRGQILDRVGVREVGLRDVRGATNMDGLIVVPQGDGRLQGVDNNNLADNR